MQTFKLARVVQIILITILVIVVGTITVAILSNHKTMAVNTTCNKCGNTVSWEYMDEATHSYSCNNKKCANFVRSDHVCRSWTPREKLSNQHSGYCIYCEREVMTACYDNNRDGFCDMCGREGTFGVKTECSQCTNKVVWDYFDEIQHAYTCSMCTNFVIANHSWITVIRPNESSSKTHIASKECEFCGYLARQEEVSCYDNNRDGICDACGRVGMHVHNYTEKICTPNDSDTHNVTLKCACGATQNGGTEKHDYKNGKCVCGKELSSSNIEIKIESGTYQIDDKYISKVIPRQTVNTIKSNINVSGAEINIYDKNNNLIQGTTRVGTGARVEIKNEKETKNFIIIVKGDANGDGNVDFADLATVNKVRLNKTTLSEPYSLAADIIDDGKVDFKDLVKINKFRLNKITKL